MIDVATLNRRVAIDRRALAPNVAGFNSVEVWQPVRTIWASIKYDSVDANFAADQAYTKRIVTFTTLFIRDLTELDRLIYEGVTYQILGITEIGFRETLEIKAEAYDPGGQ